MRTLIRLATIAVAFLATPAFAQQPPPALAPGKGIAVGATVTVKATVLSVDMATRTVELQGEAGDKRTIVVSERARNLGQVRPGDIVTFRYTEAVAVEMARRGAPTSGTAVVTTESRAKPGERPAGVRTERITVAATIESIDAKKPGVVLRDPEGKLHEVKVRNRDVLRNLKPGDEIDITFVRALAVAVTPSPKP